MSSPAVSDGRLYIGCNDDNLYCINATNSNTLWTFLTGGDIFSSPAVYDGKVYFGSDDYKIYCLNAVTGTEIWNRPQDFGVTIKKENINWSEYYGIGNSLVPRSLLKEMKPLE